MMMVVAAPAAVSANGVRLTMTSLSFTVHCAQATTLVTPHYHQPSDGMLVGIQASMHVARYAAAGTQVDTGQAHVDIKSLSHLIFFVGVLRSLFANEKNARCVAMRLANEG